MSRHKCTYRGAKTRILPCDCPSGVDVFVCACESVESSECVIDREGGRRRAAIRKSGLPVCTECTERVDPGGQDSPLIERWKKQTQRQPPDEPPPKTERIIVVPRTDFQLTCCVNLDRRPDRWEEFQRRVPMDWPFSPIMRVPAIDGEKCTPAPWWKAGRGAWGCYKSHLNIIEHCLNHGIYSVLILEDDALFCEDFSRRAKEVLEAAPPWDMLYLGGQHLKGRLQSPEIVNDHIVRPYNVNRTHAYAVRGEMLSKLYQHLESRNWRQAHHVDHHMGLLHEKREDRIYAARDWLIGQASSKSDINGHKPGDRFWMQKAFRAEQTPLVAVIGPFRGGTSCVAGVLHKLGVNMGERFAMPAADNPKGFFEAQVLASICRQSYREPHMTEMLSRIERVRRLKQWGNARRLAVGGLCGGKHPTLCLMIPELVEAWENVRLIAVDRPIEDAIASLEKLGWGWPLDVIRAVLPRMAKQRDIDLDGREHYRVKYEELVDDPAPIIDDLCKWLGHTPSDEQRLAAIGHVVARSRV